MSRKAYLYMRFSSAEQAKGDSLERQRSLAVEFIARHPEKDIQLATDMEFIDEGVSSFAGQNLQPGRALHRVMECINDGRIAPGSVLMVESLDRLSRQQVIQAQRLLLDILLSGISVITTSPAEAREYDGRAGLHDLIVSLAGMERANRESAIKSDRVRRAWKRKKESAATVKLTSRGPSWLRLNSQRQEFEVIEEKAAVVRRIFELAETIGQQAIVRILNNECIPPLTRGSTGWHESSVAKVLASPAVIGIYQPHQQGMDGEKFRRIPDGAPMENYYPGIVDKALYYRVQALRANRKIAGAGRKGSAYANIFGGIAKCSRCGSSMVVVDKGTSSKGGRYFVCSAARRGSGCTYHSVKYEHCEEGFLLYCQRVDVSDILPGGIAKTEATKLRKEAATLKGEAAQKRSFISRLLSSLESNGGELPKAIQHQMLVYERRIAEIESALTRIAAELASLESEAYRIAGMQSSFNELFRRLRVANTEERFILRSKLHAVLKAAIARIEVGALEDEGAVLAEVRSQLTDVNQNYVRNHPDKAAEATALGLTLSLPKGPLTTFNVHYKNGNVYELFIDSRSGAVAGRMTYSPAAIAHAKSAGTWAEKSGQLSLTYGALMHVEKKRQPRGEGGRFTTSSQASAQGSER